MAPWTSKCLVHKSYSSPVFLEDFEIKSLAPTQVLVKTEYASINPVDVKIHSMSFTSSVKHTLKDYSGIVTAVGSEVESVKVGDNVWGSIHSASNSDYVGSYTLADTRHDVVAIRPNVLSSEQAAAIPVTYGTAFQMLERAGAKQNFGADSSILILGGATSVGSFAIQLAKKYFNIGTVVATCSPNSAEYVTEFGADGIINYRSPDVPGEFVKYVQTAGKKFDAILDCVGGYDAISVFRTILKNSCEGSAYISIMGDTGPAASYAKTMINALISAPRVAFRLMFGKWYGINYQLFLLTHDEEWVKAVPKFFAMPGVRVPIDHVYPLADFKEAWDRVDSTRARGKVVLQFD